jgi:hypothetical protein
VKTSFRNSFRRDLKKLKKDREMLVLCQGSMMRSMREDARSLARRRDESQRGCGEEWERGERASRPRRTH